MLGDAIHNLRSVFDHFAYGIVELGSGDQSKAQFPVCAKEEWFLASIKRMLKGAPNHAIEIVRDMQPYHEGENEILLQIHKLDVVDKHRMIIPIGMVSATLTLKIVGNRIGSLRIIGGGDIEGFATYKRIKTTLKEGLVFYLPPSGREEDHDPNISFDLAFGEGQIIEGEAVVAKLHEFAQFTERAVKIFEEKVFPL
jgi:hypothetical protein